MLSGLLKNDTAVQVSIGIMNAFVGFRKQRRCSLSRLHRTLAFLEDVRHTARNPTNNV
ncbi:MAG: hypothetical protein FWG24_05740 [Eggerthellaceae bacterium]|nr:hypothetical protein [Eggerthellaceae bacterium]